MRPSRRLQFVPHVVAIASTILSLLIGGEALSLAASVRASWQAPTTDAEGNTLTDLAGYKVYYGPSSRNYTAVLDVGNTLSVSLSGLTAGQTYYFAITAYDRSENESTWSTEVSATPTEVPPGTFTDTTMADFSAGTLDANINISQTTNGEVILAPFVGAEFTGTALPAGWTTTPWSAGGTASVAVGMLTVDGARAGTTALFKRGRSVEFVTTFSGQAYQHVGFGVTFSQAPWAIFSTSGGGQLYAWTKTSSSSMNTALGSSWLGTSHRYRVDWNTNNTVYSIDGTVVATHALTPSKTQRPLISDLTPTGGAIVVDWLRMTPYAASGTFLSRLFDAGSNVTWGTATWTSDLPNGTSLNISVRRGNTPTPDQTWTAFANLSGSGATIGGSSRYLQYRAQLATTVQGQTPVLLDLTVTY
jgi:Glycosyl hydrolases family 16